MTSNKNKEKLEVPSALVPKKRGQRLQKAASIPDSSLVDRQKLPLVADLREAEEVKSGLSLQVLGFLERADIRNHETERFRTCVYGVSLVAAVIIIGLCPTDRGQHAYIGMSLIAGCPLLVGLRKKFAKKSGHQL